MGFQQLCAETHSGAHFSFENYAHAHLLYPFKEGYTMSGYSRAKVFKKRGKRPSSFEREPIYIGDQTLLTGRFLHEVYMPMWALNREKISNVTITYYARAVSSERLWARLFRPAYRRE